MATARSSRRATIRQLLERRRAADHPAVVVLGMRPADPAQYGRLIVGADGMLEAIVEHRDANAGAARDPLCNSGVMAIDGSALFALLDRVGNDNAKGEYYLTDIVALARADGAACAVVEAPADELHRHQQPRRAGGRRGDAAGPAARAGDGERRHADRSRRPCSSPPTPGSAATSSIGPNVVFGPGVEVADGVEIKAFCHIEGAKIETGAVIGPFARLRPGSGHRRATPISAISSRPRTRRVGTGAKANHLTYLGDAVVGAGANIGAGTITANYDGFNKHKTEIGADASIGSNSVLVAPVKVGRRRHRRRRQRDHPDVSADALAVARGRQTEKPGWAAKFRESKGALGKGTVDPPRRQGLPRDHHAPRRAP